MDERRGVLERGSFCAPLFLLQSLLARSDFCRGRIPQPHRPARALATKRAALHMPTDRSGEITLSIYADGPSAMYSDLRPSWPTRDSTFDRSRRNTKRRDHNDLFDFVAMSTPSTARERRRRRPPPPNLLQRSWSRPRPWTWWMGGYGRGPTPGHLYAEVRGASRCR